MDAIIQILMNWGYVGLFIASIVAGSILPFCSELVLGGLYALGLNVSILVIVATIGNTIGGMTCYYMGRLGRIDWIECYCHIRHDRILRMQKFLQGKGALMSFFSFIPGVGAVIVVALGLMRSNHFLTLIAMTAGKLARYIVLVMAIDQTVKLI